MAKQQARVPAGTAKQEGAPRPPQLFVATNMQKVGETGVHTHFNTLVTYLNSIGTRVEIITPYEAPAILRRLVGVIMRLILRFNVELAWRFRDHFYAQLLHLRMRQVLPANQPWIVYAQCPVSSATTQHFRKRRDQHIVLVTHFNRSHADEMVESGLILEGGGFYRKIVAAEHAALLGADRIVFVSEYLRHHLHAAHRGLGERPSIVLPNFIARPKAKNAEYSGDLVSIGTLEARKNQSFLLYVLAAAKRRERRYTLTLFGAGKPEAEWRQLAVELGIADQVTFAGYVADASRYLRNFRVYVHAARMENLPVSLIEAMACGLPAVAACVGGIPEVIAEGKTGLFWNLDDAEGAAGTLIGLLEDSARLDAMGTAAAERYSEHFSVERIAPRLADFMMDGSLAEAKSTPESKSAAGVEPLVPPLHLDRGTH